MNRRGFSDVFVEDAYVKIVVDISGLNPEDIIFLVSKKGDSFIIKHRITNVVLEIRIPVLVTNRFKCNVNNGVLEAEIER